MGSRGTAQLRKPLSPPKMEFLIKSATVLLLLAATLLEPALPPPRLLFGIGIAVAAASEGEGIPR